MQIAIDYDGTIAEYIKGNWGIHPLLGGAVKRVNELIHDGHDIVIYTARHNGERGEGVENETLLVIENNFVVPVHFNKPDVDILIDDRATKYLKVDTNVGITQVEDDWLKVVPYFEALRDVLAKLPISRIDKAIEILEEVRYDNLAVATCGNGGSMATAQHFACDLQKIGFIATALDSQPTLTMWANDEDFSEVFSRQLKLFCPDIVIAISGSGKSLNILNAITWAQATGRQSIVLLGDMEYNCAAELADVAIVVPSDDYQIIEDCHLAICHYIITRLRNDNFQNPITD